MDFELQEELQALQDLANYDIPNEHDIPSMDPRSIAHVLENAVEALAESSDAITDPQVFDAYRSLLKHAESLPGPLMNKMLDSITSGFQAQVEATHRDRDRGPTDYRRAQEGPRDVRLSIELVCRRGREGQGIRRGRSVGGGTSPKSAERKRRQSSRVQASSKEEC